MTQNLTKPSRIPSLTADDADSRRDDDGLGDDSADAELARILESYLAAIEAGHAPSAADLVAAHPHLAERLEGCLASLQFLEQAGEQIRPDAATPRGIEPSASGLQSPAFAAATLGDFRLVRELGRGGMGVVYEAEQLSLGRRVAVKVLPFAAMLDERQLARFKNEARAAAGLHHPHIVPVYYVGAERGVHFYAMQYIEGQSLGEMRSAECGVRNEETHATLSSNSAIRTRHSALDTQPVAAAATLPDRTAPAFFRRIAELGAQAAAALHYAHESGVVHRDVKPSNLLVERRHLAPRDEPSGLAERDGYHLWVADFGLARIGSDPAVTRTGDLVGTLRYMSPEQLRGKAAMIDHRTDVYSLGVTLYELLTHRHAFAAESSEQLLKQILDAEPPSLRSLNRAIPADLETIVLKAIRKDAESRYATAQEFADDLRRFLDSKSILARRPTPLDRLAMWSRRHAVLLAASVTTLLVVVGVCVASALVTLRAYKSESEQRTAAESNLAVASQLIDRMLSRAADDRYWHGDLARAEKLAADATRFYDDLLQHSDDPELRFRAARAHGDVAHIWELAGRNERAAVAYRRGGELLLRLTTSHPGQPAYLAALADNYNGTGLVDWALDRPIAAEPSWRQAWEIWSELAEQHPQEPSYQDGVARMLANLGCICYFTDRFEEAEAYYRRSEAIAARLPEAMRNSPAGLASQAGSITNQAELARLRGEYDRALELLEASIPLHRQSLEKWPTNPVALDCYWYTLWNIGECQLAAGRAAEAAAAVEQMIAAFPKRLDAYHQGAAQLLRCAAIGTQSHPAPSPRRGGSTEHGRPKVARAQVVPVAEHSGRGEAAAKQSEYHDRAHNLLTAADSATIRTPATLERFAWFLLTCDEQSFRDTPRALALAKDAVEAAPEHAGAWFTLALAHYRNGDWQSADDAVEHSVKHSPGGEANAYDWLLLSMLRAQQGRTDEARQWHKKASDWIAQHNPTDQDLLGLAAEADVFLSESNPPQL